MNEEKTPEEVKKVLIKNIKAERARAGLTQLETAEKLGMSLRTYTKKEQKGNIDTYTIYKLAKIFQCQIESFYMGI